MVLEPKYRMLICVPTYNESESILGLLTRVGQVRTDLLEQVGVVSDLLVIDDNSPDGTADLVAERGLDWVEILRRSEKNGLGPAYIAGFRVAIDRGYDFIVEMDADLSHQPEALGEMLAPIIESRADLTIGTRWMPGGKVVNWPFIRQLISRVGTGYARIALRLDLRDITSGFRVFRREVLEAIDLNAIEAKGYGFQIEMALRTLELGFRAVEVPITFIERAGGVSKMNKRIVIEALWKVTLWGLSRSKKSR